MLRFPGRRPDEATPALLGVAATHAGLPLQPLPAPGPVTPGETQLSPTASWCRGLPQPPTPLSEQETEARPGELTCRGPLGVSLSQVEALFSAACRARMAGSSGLGVGSPVSQDTHQPLANWTGGHRLQDRCPVASEAASKGTKLSPMLPVITTTEVTLLGCCSVSRAPPAPRPRQAVRRCPTWLPPETPTGCGGRTRVPGALSSGVGARAGGPVPSHLHRRAPTPPAQPRPGCPVFVWLWQELIGFAALFSRGFVARKRAVGTKVEISGRLGVLTGTGRFLPVGRGV